MPRGLRHWVSPRCQAPQTALVLQPTVTFSTLPIFVYGVLALASRHFDAILILANASKAVDSAETANTS